MGWFGYSIITNYSTILVGGDWNMTRLYPYANHGAVIFTNIYPIFTSQM
jgi:predicted transcriptional regulator